MLEEYARVKADRKCDSSNEERERRALQRDSKGVPVAEVNEHVGVHTVQKSEGTEGVPQICKTYDEKKSESREPEHPERYACRKGQRLSRPNKNERKKDKECGKYAEGVPASNDRRRASAHSATKREPSRYNEPCYL